MQKSTLIAVLLLIFSCSFSFLHSQEQSFTNKLFKFGLGYLTGQMTHEIGHYVVATSLGVHIYPIWNIKNIPPLSYGLEPVSWQKYNIISAGGFFFECISSDIILESFSLKTEENYYDYFLLGWLCQTIFCPISYTIIEEINSGYHGDIWGIHNYNNIQNIKGKVEIFIVGHACITALRTFLKLKAADIFQISSTPTSLSMQISF